MLSYIHSLIGPALRIATEPFEGQVATTLQELERNAREVAMLVARLQVEVADRTRTLQDIEARLQELQQQRKLLDLTQEQKTALEALARRQPAVGEIFRSLDFWLGRFLLTALFFLAGIAFTLWRSRKTAAKVTRLDRIEQGIDQLIAQKRLTPEEAEGIGYVPRIHPLT